MEKIIDEKIKKQILDGLKTNEQIGFIKNQYILPIFELCENGEYEYKGNKNIYKLSDFSKCLNTYLEIAAFIKKKYNLTIFKVYKNALNSLIASKGRFRLSINDYSMVSKLENDFNSNIFSQETADNYEDMLRVITKAAYKTSKLKLNENFNLLLLENNSFSGNGKPYILPLMSENGVVFSQNKGNKNLLEAQFSVVSEKYANNIKDFMLETANNQDDENNNMKLQIVKLFELSEKAGLSVSENNNRELLSQLTELTSGLVELVGVDLSAYEKQLSLNENKNDKNNLGMGL